MNNTLEFEAPPTMNALDSELCVWQRCLPVLIHGHHGNHRVIDFAIIKDDCIILVPGELHKEIE